MEFAVVQRISLKTPREHVLIAIRIVNRASDPLTTVLPASSTMGYGK
jgi:hypothetical protein